MSPSVILPTMSDNIRRLVAENESKLHCLMRLAHESVSDEPGRCMAVTGAMISLWQVAGDAMPFCPPWVLSVHSGVHKDDPVDELVRIGAELLGKLVPHDQSKFAHQARQIAPILVREYEEKSRISDRARQYALQCNKPAFFNYITQGFGVQRVAFYADRFHPQLQLVAYGTTELLLRVERAQDWELFRRHVALGRPFFDQLRGYNANLQLERKTVNVSGVLSQEDLTQGLLETLLSHPLPVVFLPHLATGPLNVPKAVNFQLLLCQLRCGIDSPRRIVAPEPPQHPWCDRYQEHLRFRLRHFTPYYEAFMLRTLREILTSCGNVVIRSADDGDSVVERNALYNDLIKMCLRGLGIGVTALAYYGYGFDAGCARQVLLDFLGVIRSQNATNRRDLQRKFPRFNATQRDAVLEKLAAEGLIELGGRDVVAVPWRDFFHAVTNCPALVFPPYESPQLMKLWKT